MRNFLIFLTACVVLAVVTLYAVVNVLQERNAPIIAQAQARIEEARARQVEARAEAATANLEELLNFLSVPLAMLIVAAVMAGTFVLTVQILERFIAPASDK